MSDLQWWAVRDFARRVWTAEDVWQETMAAYAELKPDPTALTVWFEARRGGPDVYAAWRQEHIKDDGRHLKRWRRIEYGWYR